MFLKVRFSPYDFNQAMYINVLSNYILDPIPKEPDWDLFEKLREANEKQRDMLRCRDKEYQDKLCESESVNLHLKFLQLLLDVTVPIWYF
jgi:hypothetical protein